MTERAVPVRLRLGRPLHFAVNMTASMAGMTPEEWVLRAIDEAVYPIRHDTTDSRKPFLILEQPHD